MGKDQRNRRWRFGLAEASLALVATAAVMGWAASFVGLHDFGVSSMQGYSDTTAWFVPATFDGAAFGTTLITYRASINGRGAMRARVLMWAFTAVSSWINWVHQPPGKAQFVAAGLPIAAVAVFDVVMLEMRGDYEARHGRRAFRLRPGLLLMRWLVDASGTAEAFREQIRSIPVTSLAGLGSDLSMARAEQQHTVVPQPEPPQPEPPQPEPDKSPETAAERTEQFAKFSEPVSEINKTPASVPPALPARPANGIALALAKVRAGEIQFVSAKDEPANNGVTQRVDSGKFDQLAEPTEANEPDKGIVEAPREETPTDEVGKNESSQDARPTDAPNASKDEQSQSTNGASRVRNGIRTPVNLPEQTMEMPAITATALRNAARDEVRSALSTGGTPPKVQELAERYGRTERWARDQLKAVRQELDQEQRQQPAATQRSR